MDKKYIHTSKILEERRRELRNNLTIQEIILWKHLKSRGLGYKFQRQHSIGPYITDFYCAEKKLIIEIDGSQHDNAKEYDKERTDFLEELGNTVLRFWNSEINTNLDGVLQKIKQAL